MDYSKEEWKPVINYEGLYEVSNFGRVRSLGRRVNYTASGVEKTLEVKPRFIKQSKGSYGYTTVGLFDEAGNSKTFTIHLLVCPVFNGSKPFPTAVVRHLDGVHTNNAASNLKWGTHKENEADKKDHGRRQEGEKHYKASITKETALNIKACLDAGVKGGVVAKTFGVDKHMIHRIRHGKHGFF